MPKDNSPNTAGVKETCQPAQRPKSSPLQKYNLRKVARANNTSQPAQGANLSQLPKDILPEVDRANNTYQPAAQEANIPAEGKSELLLVTQEAVENSADKGVMTKDASVVDVFQAQPEVTL